MLSMDVYLAFLDIEMRLEERIKQTERPSF